ncbi:MAG: hypothetical protein HC772_05785, partial [Leptolyngbyaceae cyanobacterium CRU_2_3]|nr:hypothetical protein [Leptolyngbyaceae cyanobacterium CRU_2_3]
MHSSRLKWASALSTRPSLEAAVKEVSEQAQRLLQDSADLGLVFISSAFASEYSRLMPLLKEHLTSAPFLIGCGGGGVVGVNAAEQIQEIEGEAALSLTLARLPDVKIHPFHIEIENLPDLDGPPDAWSTLVGVLPQD